MQARRTRPSIPSMSQAEEQPVCPSVMVPASSKTVARRFSGQRQSCRRLCARLEHDTAANVEVGSSWARTRERPSLTPEVIEQRQPGAEARYRRRQGLDHGGADAAGLAAAASVAAVQEDL